VANLPNLSVPMVVIPGTDDEVNPSHKCEGHHRFSLDAIDRKASLGPDTPIRLRMVRFRTKDLVQSPKEDFSIVRRRTAKGLFVAIPATL
jgi:hypothetical protein